MKSFKLDRRAFLRGVGSAAVALPLLEAMGCGKTSPGLSSGSYGLGGAPKRIIFFWSPDGTVPDAFKPTTGAGGLELKEILAPLEPHKASLLVPTGLNMQIRDVAIQTGFPFNAHLYGAGAMLSNALLQKGSLFNPGGDSPPSGWGGGITLDQHLADQIGAATRFRSLELGVQVEKNNVWSRISYQGPAQPLPPENSPYAVFDRLFRDLPPGGTPPPDPGADPVLQNRVRVLDLVQEKYRALSARLGASDKARLDAHLSAVEDLEAGLTFGGGDAEPTTSCGPPVLGAPIDVLATANYPQIGKLQMDCLAMALACDLTRVATLQWSKSTNEMTFPWLGLSSKTHHQISHIPLTDADAKAAMIKINNFFAAQLAYLIAKLKAIPEGDGSVFDNTVIVWFNAITDGQRHRTDDVPIVMAGNLGGTFQTGRTLAFSGRTQGDLLVNLMNGMGVAGDTFGDPRACSGPLAGLG